MPASRKAYPRPCPAIGPWTGVIDAWLVADKTAPRKQRHTARRIWQRLVAEHAPPNVLLVAVDESDAVVGYTAVHPEDGEMFLLFVHPAHAGRGIGRSLLAAAHAALHTVFVKRGPWGYIIYQPGSADLELDSLAELPDALTELAAN